MPAVIFNFTNVSVSVHSNDYNRAYDSQNDVSSAGPMYKIYSFCANFGRRTAWFTTMCTVCLARMFICAVSREQLYLS